MRADTAVRLAVLDDAAAIARVHVASWRVAYAGLMPDAVRLHASFTVERREARWRDILARGASEERTFVVVAGGHIAGFASTGPNRDEGADPATSELYALYLDPDAWGLGLGRTLLAEAVADLRARARSAVTLWVLEGNVKARRFYEAAAMRADGAIRVDEEAGVALPHLRYARSL